MNFRLLCFDVILIILLFFSNADAQTQSETITLTMDRAISLALEKNRDILIAKQAQKKADQQVREARSGAFPRINVANIYTRNIFRPAFFLSFDGEVQKIQVGAANAVQSIATLNQTLYSGGRTWVAIDIAKLYSESFNEALDFTEKSIVFQVKQQFLAVLMGREVLQVSSRNLELADSHYKNLQTLYSKGAASEFDLLRSEVQVANTKPVVISAENSLELQKDRLKVIIGLPLESNLEIIGELTPEFIEEPSLVEASQEAHLSRSDYKNLELTREAMNKRIRIERAGWFPTISLTSQYQFSGQADNFTFGPQNTSNSVNAMLNINFSIFDGFQTASKVQQAQIDVKDMDLRMENLKQNINIQVLEALNKMEEARKRYDALNRSVAQAQKAYDIALVMYNSGQGTQLDLFDSQIALETAQLNNLQSIFDYEIAKAQWHYSIGRN
ncbi:MAG: TolC family protein [bacterium]|nr:TolC family protein [bacterium]